jgi:hypothetical protein
MAFVVEGKASDETLLMSADGVQVARRIKGMAGEDLQGDRRRGRGC